MGRCRWFIAVASAALLGSALLAACGSDNSKTSTSNTTAAANGSGGGGAYGAYGAGANATTPTTAASGPLVATKTTAKGSVLVDASGMTLYRFDKDSGTTIACTAACAGTWPPLTAPSGTTTVAAAAGIDQLALVARPDGGQQVTHANHPLYRYSGDTKPGDVNGDGIGGVWHVELSSGATASGSSDTTASSQPYSAG